MIDIILENEQSEIDICEASVNKIKEALAMAFSIFMPGVDASIDILITSDEEMKILNQEFRGMDKSTDVLSFPMYEFSFPCVMKGMDSGDLGMEGIKTHMGDIAISAKTAYIQAGDYGHSFERELVFLAVHGTLHLMGFDHISDDDEKAMQKAQRDIMDAVDLRR